MSQIQKLIRSVQQELLMLKQTPRRKYVTVEHFEKLSQDKQGYVYELWLSEGLRLQEQVWLTLEAAKHNAQAMVVRIQDNQNPVIMSKEPLNPRHIYRIDTSFDPGFILEALSEALNEVKPDSERIVKNLLHRQFQNQTGYPQKELQDHQLNPSQSNAVKKAWKFPISVIWGPPGTGKTHTLGHIIQAMLSKRLSVLVLSISNVALDQVILSVLKQLSPSSAQKKQLYRLGITDEPTCKAFLVPSDDSKVISGSRVVFSTLASLALQYKNLSTSGFNTVIIDEASMVSLPYAAIAANLAVKRLIIAGDFRQLPPISLSENKYMKMNPFDYLGVPNSIAEKKPASSLTMLETQYRMTKGISKMVSEIFYQGRLKCGVKLKPEALEKVFIDVGEQSYCKTFYSVDEKSYYQPNSAGLIYELVQQAKQKQQTLLYLTPYRAQQTFINNFLLDQKMKLGRALTVHKAQGTERDWVIFDFTTYAKNRGSYSRLLKSEMTAHLINVALSRAKKRIIVIGNMQLLSDLGLEFDFYKHLHKFIQNEFKHLDAADLFQQLPFNHNKLVSSQAKQLISIDYQGHGRFLSEFQTNQADLKIYVAPPKFIEKQTDYHGITFWETDSKLPLPAVSILGSQLCLHVGSQVYGLESQIGGKTLARLAIGHWLELDEATSKDTLLLNCGNCNGNKTVQRIQGVFKLLCSNCRRGEMVSTKTAKHLQRLYQVKCPQCNADMSPRNKQAQSFPSFYGCNNFPRCQGVVDFAKAFYISVGR